MKKTSLADADCPIARALSIVGDLWSLLIVRQAMQGTRRFNEFAHHLGLARNILASRLKKLVEYGVLEVLPASDGSAYSEYALTPKGRDLFITLVALWQWSETWVASPEDRLASLVDRRDRLPVAALQLRAHDGRALEPEDVRLLEGERAERAS